jgi:hypothetical protein
MYKPLHNAAALFIAASILTLGARGATGLPPLRELRTDRPDATESPFTVDAGHAQLELDLISFTRDRKNGETTEVRAIAPFNVRLGLTARFELGLFVVPSLRVETTQSTGVREIHSGAGDVTLRAKWNFLGNDSGSTAFGLIADLKLPTAARGIGNGDVEGALLLPFNRVFGEWELGAMTGVDLHVSDSSGRRRGGWINTITVAHDVMENVGAYLELTSAAGDGAHVATLDGGICYKVKADLQFDIGAELGLTRAADDLRVFSGVSRRF